MHGLKTYLPALSAFRGSAVSLGTSSVRSLVSTSAAEGTKCPDLKRLSSETVLRLFFLRYVPVYLKNDTCLSPNCYEFPGYLVRCGLSTQELVGVFHFDQYQPCFMFSSSRTLPNEKNYSKAGPAKSKV